MPVLTEERKNGGIIGPPRWPGGFGGDDESGEPGSSFPLSRGQVGMWLLLTGVTMLFAGLTSAYIVLRGVPAWQNIALPPLVSINTFVLLASSVTLELARRAANAGRLARVKQWIAVSALLGVGFLIGQVVAWRALVDAGIYLPTTLHSSFFYVLTGVHGVHLIGGVAGMLIVLYRAFAGQLSASRHEPLRLCALYWHFMDGVWIYLFLLLMLA